MNALFRSVYTIVLFLALFVFWILAWALQWVAYIVMLVIGLGRVDKHQYYLVASKIYRTLNWVVMDLLNPFWSCNVVAPLPAIAHDPKQKYIVMMNHLSNADPWVILSTFNFGPRDWKFVCKGSLFSVPFGGWGLKLQGDMPIYFTADKGGWGTEKGGTAKLMEMSEDHLDNSGGRAVVAVFPEGIRNPEPYGDMREFKAGFFDLALKKGYKILPVAISGSERCWPVRQWQLDAAKVYVSCAQELISPEGHDRDSLIKAVRTKIAAMRDAHPDRMAMAAAAAKKE